MNYIKTVGSICSGIEAASVAWESLGMKFEWFSEIGDFPSRVLADKYPHIQNLGDINNIPCLIVASKIKAPDLICGGTPCQSFSFAGWKNGLNDDRGNLTLKFVDIIDSNDKKRIEYNKKSTIVFWENVEGVLSDKTNAFGCLVCSLAGLEEVIQLKRWPNAGVIHGIKRNVAWRVLDAKYFGVPQQRRRLYLMAGGKDFFPENVLFEYHLHDLEEYPTSLLKFEKDGHSFEVFREYTDCLYSSYGTKWNGNAAAYNGSLFVVQDNRIRRFSPLECERLMGFQDDYTNINGAKRTNRYKALGNSWAVPVVRYIGKRLLKNENDTMNLEDKKNYLFFRWIDISDDSFYINFDDGLVKIGNEYILNCTAIPESCKFIDIQDIVSADAPEDIYISPVGCYGIVRRSTEGNIKLNPQLKQILLQISSQMPISEIEQISHIQKRGMYSFYKETNIETKDALVLKNLFNF